ncbi:hypothetical protein MMC25_004555 [Agyrium rufum]|nr:hypothetical protein [Agyrium rufum]
MSTSTSSTSPLDHVQAAWSRQKANSPIYGWLFTNVELLEADHGLMTASLTLEPHHLNSKGTLHGSVSATLTDWAGGMAIASTGLLNTGVSTDIHVSYISTARLGEVIKIEAHVLRCGSTMAFTKVDILKQDGQIIAAGTHTKAIRRQEGALSKP